MCFLDPLTVHSLPICFAALKEQRGPSTYKSVFAADKWCSVSLRAAWVVLPFFSPLKILAFLLSLTRGKYGMRTRGNWQKVRWVVSKDFLNFSRTWPCPDQWITGAVRLRWGETRESVLVQVWGLWVESLLLGTLLGVPFSTLPRTVSTRGLAFAWPLESSGMWCKWLNFREIFFSGLHLDGCRGLSTSMGSVS